MSQTELARIATDSGSGQATMAPAELAAAFDAVAQEAGEAVTKSKDWPKTIQKFASLLTRLAPAMRAVGIKMTRDRTPGGNRHRSITLTLTERTARPARPGCPGCPEPNDPNGTRTPMRAPCR